MSSTKDRWPGSDAMVVERGISGSSTRQSHSSSCILLGHACSEDARVALLESVCVVLVLHTGREISSNETSGHN